MALHPTGTTWQEALRLFQAGQLSACRAVCAQIPENAPEYALSQHLLGVMACLQGDFVEAHELTSRACTLQPRNHEILNTLATVLLALNRPEEARSWACKAASVAPGSAVAHNTLGNVYRALRDFDEAVACYRRAVECGPDTPEALVNLADCYLQQGRAGAALPLYRQAATAQPALARAHAGLANALAATGQTALAQQAFDRAITLQPGEADHYNHKAMAMMDQGHHRAALALLQKGLGLAPDSVAVLNNTALCCQALGLHREAREALDRALFLEPDNASLHINQGKGCLVTGEYAKAEQYYRAALALDPGAAMAHNNLAMVLLLTGRFSQGFDEYRWRWQVEHTNARKLATVLPPWDGRIRAGQRVLLWSEQGVGDEILFVRFVPSLRAAGVECVLVCEQRLQKLFSRSFAGATVIAKGEEPSPLIPLPSAQVQAPLGDLLTFFCRRAEDVTPLGGYLKADERYTAMLAQKYRSGRKVPLVGISWRSGNPLFGQQRSAPLEFWGPVLKLPGIVFVSLQYGVTAEEINETDKRFGMRPVQDHEIDPLQDMDTFAAQVAAMDLVISVDNSTVHMAGALGVAAWTLLPFVPDWRWLLERDDTIWYPDMQLFRQQQMDDWQTVFKHIAKYLADYLAKYVSTKK